MNLVEMREWRHPVWFYHKYYKTAVSGKVVSWKQIDDEYWAKLINITLDGHKINEKAFVRIKDLYKRKEDIRMPEGITTQIQTSMKELGLVWEKKPENCLFTIEIHGEMDDSSMEYIEMSYPLETNDMRQICKDLISVLGTYQKNGSWEKITPNDIAWELLEEESLIPASEYGEECVLITEIYMWLQYGRTRIGVLPRKG